MRAVVTGAAGMLGRDLTDACKRAGHDVLALSRSELDITDADAVAGLIRQARPAVVFNCAAYTNVDGAEGEEGLAEAVNGAGAGNVARAANDAGAWTVHVSSDYVFDGEKREPYVESDAPAPLSAYGRTKRSGELAVVRAAPERHTIVRSSWLFGTGSPCFPATIIRLALERDELTVVDDQVGCPTYTAHLAAALVTLGEQRALGIVHAAGGGHCSWFEFAVAIVDAAGLQSSIRPGRTRELARPAARPAYSVLRSERGEAPILQHWREGLAAYMAAGVTVG